MATDIWIPPTAVEPKKRVWSCTSCGSEFPIDQKTQFQRHAVSCAKKNADLYEAHVAAMNENAFTSISDTEQYAFLRKRAAESPLRGT